MITRCGNCGAGIREVASPHGGRDSMMAGAFAVCAACRQPGRFSEDLHRLTPVSTEWLSPRDAERAQAALDIIDELFPDGLPYSWENAAVCDGCKGFYWPDCPWVRLKVAHWELCALCEQPTQSGLYRRLLVASVPSKGMIH